DFELVNDIDESDYIDEDVWSVYRALDNLICNEPLHKVSDDTGTDENENENEATK
ncbi:hypothetical protein Dimus_037025, partial [Dionaea muscipula]